MDTILEYALPVLAITPLRWENLAKAIPVELLTRQPTDRQWSALECLQHLLDSEVIFTARIQYFVAGKDIPDFNPDQEGTELGTLVDPGEMVRQFARLREKNLETLSRLTAGDYQRSSVHSELGTVTLGEMIHEWSAHDLNHTIQAERAIMQPLIRESGPWQVYFKDHVVIPGK